MLSNVQYMSDKFFQTTADHKLLVRFDKKYPELAKKMPAPKRLEFYRSIVMKEVRHNNVIEFRR